MKFTILLAFFVYKCDWDKMSYAEKTHTCQRACVDVQEMERRCRAAPDVPPIQMAQPCNTAEAWRTDYDNSCSVYYPCP